MADTQAQLPLPELHARALDVTAAIVAGTSEDQLDDPTPCEGWSVTDLINHLVSGNYWAGELAAGKTIDEAGDRLDGDLLGDDFIHAYNASAKTAAEVFRAPGAMDAACAVSYGPVPGRIYCGHRFTDVLIHGWDLATATGQDTGLPADLVDACEQVIVPQVAAFEAAGAFGENIDVADVADDADVPTRLLALLGRRA